MSSDRKAERKQVFILKEGSPGKSDGFIIWIWIVEKQ